LPKLKVYIVPIAIAEMAESPVYIVHLSCADALNQVRQARDRGIPAFAETCPQYLFLSIDDYGEDFQRRKVCDDPTTAREVKPGRALERVEDG
jgi:dihydroorotase-like cyclic amidohydrolase